MSRFQQFAILADKHGVVDMKNVGSQAPLSLLPEIGALAQWRSELKDGSRDRFECDTLFHAACLEARARDSARDGLYQFANDDRLYAAVIVARAIARKPV